MSAIYKMILAQEENLCDAELAREARAELSALRAGLAAARARNTELEAFASDVKAATYMPDGARLSDEVQRIMSERDEARAELAEYRTLRPVACNRQCFERGWKAAQEAAAKEICPICAGRLSQYKPAELIDGGWAHVPVDNGYASRCIARNIRALQPPANCDGCNPLEPANAAHDDLKIIYQNQVAHGIRDTTGFLFFFTDVNKYPGQEERYRREVKEQNELADYILSSLKDRRKNQ